MKDAMIYSYTYTPLIGMTSETDPSGSTTIYEYDDFKRLETKKVKDINQLDYILKHIDYHYKNQ
jgi:YD repeat-containing protein